MNLCVKFRKGYDHNMIRHLVDFNDLTVDMWEKLRARAQDIMEHPADYADACKGKLLATLFYEPSTRTMLSFQTAMLRLGGSVIGFDNPGNSSVSKGESLKDTITIVSSYADIIAMRHYQEGAALAASLYSAAPIINAGDGGHFHPTQTLTDLFTITKEKQTLTGLTIGLCGDLKNGRTVHSLLRALSMFGKNKYYLISTDTLKLPEYIVEILRAQGSEVYAVSSLEECMDELDILYMTRIQKERFASEEQYRQQSGLYILDTNKLKTAKKDLIVLHPLPRVDEIAEPVDFDERALYFKQARNGMFIRMSLIMTMLENKTEAQKDIFKYMDKFADRVCTNPACITKTEKYLPVLTSELPLSKGGKHCKYCDFSIE